MSQGWSGALAVLKRIVLYLPEGDIGLEQVKEKNK